MAAISPGTKLLLEEYENIFNTVNQGTIPNRQFLSGGGQLIDDFNQITNAVEADQFFEKYGVGNASFDVHNPFERQRAYELLLDILHSSDKIQFYRIHKGTPYYFIGWTAYQCKDFAKAIFYMDAAVSEDLKIQDVQSKIITKPALDFFLLNSNSSSSGLVTHLLLYDVVKSTIDKYNIIVIV